MNTTIAARLAGVTEARFRRYHADGLIGPLAGGGVGNDYDWPVAAVFVAAAVAGFERLGDDGDDPGRGPAMKRYPPGALRFVAYAATVAHLLAVDSSECGAVGYTFTPDGTPVEFDADATELRARAAEGHTIRIVNLGNIWTRVHNAHRAEVTP